MKRALALVFLLACGGGNKVTTGPKTAEVGLPPANPLAVQRMVEGVSAAKDPKLQTRAIALFREAIQIDPGLWEARFDLGLVLANQGDLAGAEEQLRAASKTAPEREDVTVALSEVLRRRGSNKDAAGILEDFVKDHPGAIDARTLLVTSLRDSGQHDKAIAQAREVLVRKPGDPTALSELALCHLAKGERETAQLLVRQALDVSPKSAIAHRVQGLVQLAAGDDSAAFAAFSKAAQEDPHDTTSRLNMGAVLLRAGAYRKAAEQYKSALAAAPGNAMVWTLSSGVRAYIGEGRAAIDRAERGLRLSPVDTQAYFYLLFLALAHYVNGTYEESVIWGRKSMGLNPRLCSNMRWLIASLVGLGKIGEARHVAQTLLQIQPRFRLSTYAQWCPLQPEFRAGLLDKLRLAGIPD